MNVREYQKLVRRAESAGYDGDIADLIDDPEPHDCEQCGEPAEYEQLAFDPPSVWLCGACVDVFGNDGDFHADLVRGA